MTESVEHVVIGAGPAGVRVAQVLAEAGREVLLLERNDEVGPKTCAGALSAKAVRELEALGLPNATGAEWVAHATFGHEQPVPLDQRHAAIRTLSRAALGRFQAALARGAGAEIRTSAAASRIDLLARTLQAGGRRIAYRRLIGAEGSASGVRRALGLPSPRLFFAGEFNVAGLRLEPLYVAFDSEVLASGYFWVFPHATYTSVGAGGNKRLVPPAGIRPYVERRIRDLGVELGPTPFEGATIEVEFVGFDFTGGVHLAGDAAGAASGLTGEGIYAALVTGEEVALRILEPHYPSPKTRAWLRVKRLHDAVGRFWLRRRIRESSFTALRALCRLAPTRRLASAFFLEG